MNNSIAFGTDGIRGHADQFPFTNEALVTLGESIAQWALAKYSKDQPKILIGQDTRQSGTRIKTALIEGLKRYNIYVVDGNIIPTPAVCLLIKTDSSFDCGIVISASHNPYYDNGIKIFDAKVSKLTHEDESLIINNFLAIQQLRQTAVINNQEHVTTWTEAGHVYASHLLKIAQKLTKFKSLNNIKIILDCAHGATSFIAPPLFKSLGFEVLTLGATPTGININDKCGALYPESLKHAVVTHNAQIGIAFDGDGDRIVIVSAQGEIKDGDDILALLLQLDEFKETSTIVGTVMSNSGFEALVRKNKKQFIRTSVGDKYVAQALEEHNLQLGGETSGHIILRNYLTTSDGLLVALKVLESLVTNNNWAMETFVKFPQIVINVPINQKKELAKDPIAGIIRHHEQLLEPGRLLVRYSGTEKILRIMTEATTQQKAQFVAQCLAKELQELL